MFEKYESPRSKKADIAKQILGLAVRGFSLVQARKTRLTPCHHFDGATLSNSGTPVPAFAICDYKLKQYRHLALAQSYFRDVSRRTLALLRKTSTIGLFNGFHTFAARRAFDHDLHRGVAGLPGGDPLHSIAARFRYLTPKTGSCWRQRINIHYLAFVVITLDNRLGR